ncbi:MAG: hypothetical protein LBI18_05470 [Planctomycetaceae bacterium]|nr:hypothetical protein [Planctomycetaceae bacterium]
MAKQDSYSAITGLVSYCVSNYDRREVLSCSRKKMSTRKSGQNMLKFGQKIALDRL